MNIYYYIAHRIKHILMRGLINCPLFKKKFTFRTSSQIALKYRTFYIIRTFLLIGQSDERRKKMVKRYWTVTEIAKGDVHWQNVHQQRHWRRRQWRWRSSHAAMSWTINAFLVNAIDHQNWFSSRVNVEKGVDEIR